MIKSFFVFKIYIYLITSHSLLTSVHKIDAVSLFYYLLYFEQFFHPWDKHSFILNKTRQKKTMRSNTGSRRVIFKAGINISERVNIDIPR